MATDTYWCEECAKEYHNHNIKARTVWRTDFTVGKFDTYGAKEPAVGTVFHKGDDLPNSVRSSLSRNKQLSKHYIWKYTCPQGHEADRIAMTADRCPVCQEKGAGKSYYRTSSGSRFLTRPANRPCGPCVEELNRLRAVEQAYLQQNGEMRLYRVDWSPSINLGQHAYAYGKTEDAKKAWEQLVRSAGTLPTETPSRYSEEFTSLSSIPSASKHADSVILLRPDVAEALGKLWAAWEALPPHSYESGLERGRNLIVQLSEGAITSSAFLGAK